MARGASGIRRVRRTGVVVLTGTRRVAGVIGLSLLVSPAAARADARHVALPSQGTTLQVQTPVDRSPTAVIVVTSGTDGWRGLTRDVANHLTAEGYGVIGLDARSYLVEATRRSGSLTPATLQADYVVLLRVAHEWFPNVQHIFLVGVSEGAGLSLVAAADRRVSVQLTGMVGVETPATVSLRSPYWTWTSWVTHKDEDDVSARMVDYVAAVAPTPVSFIQRSHDAGAPLEIAHEIFDHSGEPRRLDLIGSERPRYGDVHEQLFDTLRDCLQWSAVVTRRAPNQSVTAGPDLLTSRSTR